MKHNYILAGISIIGLAALTLMLNFSSPSDIGPIGVLLFFTTLYVSVLGIVALIIKAFFYFSMKKTKMSGKDYLYAAILAFGPIMILMARSFGAITPWTTGLIFTFLFLAEFFVYKRI